MIPLPLPNFIKNNLDFSIIFQMYFTYTMKRFYELYVINKIDFKLFTKINNEIIKYDYTTFIINNKNGTIYWYKTKQIKQ